MTRAKVCDAVADLVADLIHYDGEATIREAIAVGEITPGQIVGAFAANMFGETTGRSDAIESCPKCGQSRIFDVDSEMLITGEFCAMCDWESGS